MTGVWVISTCCSALVIGKEMVFVVFLFFSFNPTSALVFCSAVSTFSRPPMHICLQNPLTETFISAGLTGTSIRETCCSLLWVHDSCQSSMPRDLEEVCFHAGTFPSEHTKRRRWNKNGSIKLKYTWMYDCLMLIKTLTVIECERSSRYVSADTVETWRSVTWG